MRRHRWYLSISALVIVALACSIPSSPGGDVSLEETRIALAVQQTGVAKEQTSVAIERETLDAGGDGPVAPAVPTYTPSPIFTVESPPTVPLQSTQVDMKTRIKASNILVYEDIYAYSGLTPVIDRTVNSMNFSGGKIVNVADALGNFRDYANSPMNWDLMIVASEVRTSFSGEMYEMMYDHIDKGGAVIIETWYLDKVLNGKIAPILGKCGVTLFRDWTRNTNYDPYKYSIYWLDTSNPLLSSPNVVLAPSYPYPEWFGDAGDLLELTSSGDATLVGGLYPNRNSDYGVLAVCMGGRMVIQTFSSHDYKWDIIRPLWENYITHTLTSHYEYIQ